MHWLTFLPLWLLCIVVLVPSVLYGVAGVRLVRSRGWMLDPESNATAGFVHAFVGVLYAVALGLMVVAVQGSYSEVEGVVMTEANLASDLFRDLEAFPEPARSEMQGLTSRYVDSVIEEEWPTAARGERSEATWAVMDSLSRAVILYDPPTPHAQLVYPEVLEQVNDLLDQRRMRLFLGANGMGVVTWTVVLIGALVTIGIACFFHTPDERAHYALVGTMSAMFGLMIFMIIAMDHPLWGKNSVQPATFEVVRENIQRWEAEEVPAPVRRPAS